MFAGHIGTAMALGRAERGINVGLLVAAALLLDILLWLFVLAGLEAVTIPANFASTHRAEFVFPYSHGLVASLLWSALAAAGTWVVLARRKSMRARAALIIAAAVYSHWLLDALVHRAEMPLLGATAPAVGLGLWDHMPIALGMEAALVVLGMRLFIPGSGLSRSKSIAVGALSFLLLLFTVMGMTVAPPPPSVFAMAASSLVTLAVVCVLFAWLGRRKLRLPAR